ncbi:Integrase catalytic domain-containing protein [Aphis craccivora]|uniref:Integrase catalytic domain-containing protein n=1 Tax=Aphis craccivora TaxID=307492 RepID=A0A6G0VW97_APHCR|nr:Integrase catalytic domain-containing protein [Aphis craccivora]
MTVNTVHHTISIAVQNQLSHSTDFNTTNNCPRTRPDAIPTTAVEIPPGFVTALLDSQTQKSYVNPNVAVNTASEWRMVTLQ